MSEEAKAVQEVAKTSAKLLEVTQQFGGWVGRVLGKPFETMSGIINDQLMFRRMRNGVKIFQEAQGILDDLNVSTRRDLPPKLLLPILDNATLEEDERLQNMWARLIATAVNPLESKLVRAAYPEILSQLEPIDALVLSEVFDSYAEAAKSDPDNKPRTSIDFGFNSKEIAEDLNLPIGDVYRSLDNLYRHQLLKSYSAPTNAVVSGGEGPWPTHDYGYRAVCITELGVEFILICTNKRV